jgi:prophage regulatory protein
MPHYQFGPNPTEGSVYASASPPEVLRKTGLSRSRLYADGNFPRRVQLGARGVAWVEAEVDEWIQARIEAR